MALTGMTGSGFMQPLTRFTVIFAYQGECCSEPHSYVEVVLAPNYTAVQRAVQVFCDANGYTIEPHGVRVLTDEELAPAVPLHEAFQVAAPVLDCCDWHASGGDGAECQTGLLR